MFLDCVYAAKVQHFLDFPFFFQNYLLYLQSETYCWTL